MQNETRPDGTDGGKPLADMRGSFNMLHWIAWLFSYSVLPFLRRPGTCGTHFFGGQAAFGWLLILIFPALAFPREPMEAVVVYWLAVAGMLLVHRIKGHQLRKGGFETHSMSCGVSIFSPWVSYAKAMTLWEPLVVFLAGCLLMAVSISLGTFLLIAAAGHGFATAVMEQGEIDRKRRFKDAMWEARMMGRYRE